MTYTVFLQFKLFSWSDK